MISHRLASATRAGLAGLTIAAVARQFEDESLRRGLDPGRFFRYFTIQTNLAAAAVLGIRALGRPSPGPPAMDVVRGGLVVYVGLAGIVHVAVLAADDDSTVPWVNRVVHHLMPLALATDWLLDPPRRRLDRGHLALWAVYPLAWLGDTLRRGSVAGWYPYPIVNPEAVGARTVAVNVTRLGVLAIGLGAAVIALGNARSAPTG